MNTSQILADNSLTKTEKIRQLLALGLTRRQVADLTGGNYGFVQNVFARYWPERVNARSGFTLVPFNRKFGIEIEAHGVAWRALVQALRQAGIECDIESYNHQTSTGWKIVSDGSLTGDDAFELVSPILQGAAGLEQVKKVCEVLEQKGAKINKSCGLHVHFDAQAFGLEQFKNLIVNYSHYETVIDSFMPVSRRAGNNNFCMPVGLLADWVDTVTTIQQLVALQPSRYSKLNLTAYVRHRTVEFRQHSGTVEYSKIANWLVFLHNLVEYSKIKRVTRSEATFESLSRFQQPEVITYLQTRINQLAA